jgi:hypothetical protein
MARSGAGEDRETAECLEGFISQYYFRPGITWPERTTSGFSPAAMPAGCIFGVTGPGAFPLHEPSVLALLMSLNARVIRVMVDSLVPAGEETASGTAARHYGVGLVQRLPWLGPSLDSKLTDALSREAYTVIGARTRFDQGDETARRFTLPEVVRFPGGGLTQSAQAAWDAREDSVAQAIDGVNRAETMLHSALGLDNAAEEYIDEEYGRNPASYPDGRFNDEAELLRLYQMPIDGLIDEVVASRGGSRSIATKSYFLDRRLEVLAHVFYVEPKIRGETARLKELKARLESERDTLPRRERSKREKEIDDQDNLITELGRFRQELERVAELDYEPDLNDGVVLNIAPFHALTPWKEAKKYWDDLLNGKYEWSTMSQRLRARGVLTR